MSSTRCSIQSSGSIILCRDQILNETITITGTDLRLVYSSGRGPRNTYTLAIPASGSQVPASLRAIVVEVRIGGQMVRQRLSPTPNQTFRFEWNGHDLYDRPVYTAQPVSVKVSYEYPMRYYPVSTDFDRAFGSFAAASAVGGQTVFLQRGTMFSSISQSWSGTLRRPEPETTASITTLGGWTFDQYHQYDPGSGTLFLGDGTRRSIDAVDVVQPVLRHDPGAGVDLVQPWGVAVASDGTVYVSDAGAHRVWRVTPDGARTVFAGTGAAGFGGDGGAATAARLNDPRGLAIGPDGSLYIADSGNHRIRRIDPSGVITTVAGSGAATFGGDGGPATAAGLREPQAVLVAPDGNLFITDSGNDRIRRVDIGGVIATVAGGGEADPTDGAAGIAVMLSTPRGLAIDRDGRLYFISVTGTEGTGGFVLRLDPDGFIHLVAGGGSDRRNGIPATNANLDFPMAVAVGPDGSVYVSEESQVRRISSRGVIMAAVGPGTGDGLIGQAAGAADLGQDITGLAYGPDDYLYFVHDNAEAHVAKVGAALPGFQPGEFGIPSADGARLYIFEVSGRHLRTIDALTGALIWTFEHDAAGRLTALDGGDGNVTRVEYTGGPPSAIVAPFGQRTTLTVDAHGWLETVTDPANQVTRLVTTADGLLTQLTDPRNGTHHYTYSGQGYLTRDEDPDGRTKTLVRTDRADGHGHTVTVTSVEGRVTVYGEERFEDGRVRRTKRYADGTTTTTTVGEDGTVGVKQPDGSTVTITSVPDPRWGMMAPLTATLAEWPDGRTYTSAIERTVTLADPRNLLSLVSQVDVVTVNGKATTTTYQAATRTLTIVTPENRVTTIVLDERGRVVREQRAASLLPTLFTYDGRGRLETVSQGTGAEQRLVVLAYGEDGLLANVTDPMNRVTHYVRDMLGRVTTVTRPDGKVIGLGYDGQNNLTSVTPPGRTAHGLNSTLAGRPEYYEAPPAEQGGNAARTTWGRDRDGLVTSGTYPDGTVVTADLDGAGRPETIGLPRGQVVATYDPTSGVLASLAAPGGVSLNFGYDGGVLTSETWSGPVPGAVTGTLDDNYWLASRAINGQAVAYDRDDDGHATRAGALALTPDPATGLPVAANLGGVASTWGYNGFAEPRDIRATFNGGLLYHVAYTRDKLGRVSQRVETIGGVTATYNYDYDEVGRLREVRLNNAVVEAYTYDDNGNRLTATTVGGNLVATYDDQDRLVQQGGTSYGFNANGQLRSKVAGGETTLYTYDPRGSLLAVELPDGRTIEYVVDGQDRRIGKRIDGALVQGYLYAGSQVVAELDGAGHVVSSFVYDDGLVPAYMVKGGTTYRIVTDQLGSVRLVVNAATGQIAQRLDYDSWGNVTVDTNPGFQPFGYAGGLYDRDTGLVRFGARDYDSQTGRWTAKDPILFAGGDPNLYGYVGQDPVNLTDPTGYKCMDVWDRTWRNFKQTNKAIPGFASPALYPGIGLTTLTGGIVGNSIGHLSGLQALMFARASWGAGWMGIYGAEVATSVAITSAVNFAAVTVAFEAGVLIGSFIQAALIDTYVWGEKSCDCP